MSQPIWTVNGEWAPRINPKEWHVMPIKAKPIYQKRAWWAFWRKPRIIAYSVSYSFLRLPDAAQA